MYLFSLAAATAMLQPNRHPKLAIHLEHQRQRVFSCVPAEGFSAQQNRSHESSIRKELPLKLHRFFIFLSERRYRFAIVFCLAVRMVLLVLMEHVSYIVCTVLFEDFLGSHLTNLTNKCIPLLEGIPQHRLNSF